MRYVSAQPWRGQLGHQFSCVWYAKLFAELFDFQYLHAPFVDNTKYHLSNAACWNDFFNLGAGETPRHHMLTKLGSIEHFFGEYHPQLNLNLRYQALARLAEAVPDQYVLQFKDLGQVNPDAIRTWEARGLARPDTLLRLCQWFQLKLEGSDPYRWQASYPHPEGMVRVAVYWRNYHGYETATYSAWPAVQILQAIERIKAAVSPRPVSVVICSQFLPQTDTFDPQADHVGYILASDPKHDLRMAYKSLIEADVTVTTLGGSSSLIGVYRAFRRPTLGVSGWMIDGVQVPEQGDFAIPEKFINVV